jgi:hypothetical protein
MTGAKLKAKHGGREIKRLAGLTGSASVLVGVLNGSGVHPKADHGQTIAEVAFWNEYGTVRTPPRPFLGRTVREHNFYISEFKKSLGAYLRGDAGGPRLLAILGARAASDVKSMITAIMSPPNAESTRIAKADKSHVKADEINNPLIDTGAMRASINYEVRT